MSYMKQGIKMDAIVGICEDFYGRWFMEGCESVGWPIISVFQ